MLDDANLAIILGGLILIVVIVVLYLFYVERCELALEETNRDGTSHALYVVTRSGLEEVRPAQRGGA